MKKMGKYATFLFFFQVLPAESCGNVAVTQATTAFTKKHYRAVALRAFGQRRASSYY